MEATPTAAGFMRASPPPPETLITLTNWQDAPFNRWGFLHVRELIPTVRIGRGDGPVFDLPRAERDLGAFSFQHRGEPWTLAAALEATYTDGILVIHRGSVVFETYVAGMESASRHLLMSVSKSLTATLAGILVGDGRLDPNRTAPDYVEELRGTSWEGCTVQHLLDMRSGTAFDESDYDDLECDGRIIEEVSGYRPRHREGLPPSLYEYIPSFPNAREHGGAFEYRSLLTDVLAWVIERASGERFAPLFEREVWSRLGAEHDADLMVDPHGFAIAEAGFCLTLRDLARFGLMHLRGGEIGGRRIVPVAWIERLLAPDAELIEAFRGSPDAAGFPPGAMYHDKWWVIDPARGIYAGEGINGQTLLIHHPSDTVIAKFSTWPRAWPEDVAELQSALLLRLCDALERNEV